MSRTFRRTGANAIHLKHYYVDTEDTVNRWDLQRFGVTDPKACVARQAARFHRDRHSGSYNVPRWFRRELNKRFFRLNRDELRRCLNQECWDDHAPIPRRSNAGWYW